MDSPACILSQKRILVKNLERFSCILANEIIAPNVYQIFLPLTVITSSDSFDYVGSLLSDLMCCWTRLLLFFVGEEEIVFLPMDRDWCLSLRSFCFQLQNLALVKVRIAFHYFPKNLCPFIFFLFCDCGV